MKRFLLPISSLVIAISTIGTSPVKAQHIDSLLGIHRQFDPQQKAYLHFDKNFYNPGETIWFKAYLFDGLERAESSKNFYAELLDDAGKMIDRKTAPIFSSGAASHFELPAAINQSTLYVKAYTVAMLNGDTNFLYIQPIHIVTGKKVAAKAKPVADIKFLPEGGDWVAGINANIAFKATNTNGEPVYVSGTVKNSGGEKLADFTSLHDGMGSINITPIAGQTYTAYWKDEYKKEHTTPLPAFKAAGVTLQINAADNGRKFTIQRSDNADENSKKLILVATMSQQVVYQAGINLQNKTSAAAIIPADGLPTGIMQVTVFDANMQPVAERICFINNGEYEFDADAWFTQINPARRGLNAGEIKISDTTLANLSLSITDADLNSGMMYKDNIVSHLLLTGDLRGKINDPYYYFFSTSDSLAYQLDLVMLTNGWRRYNWPDIMAGKKPSNLKKESDYLSIKGKVIQAQGGAFAANLQLNGFMQMADSSSSFLVLPVNRDGSVENGGYIFYDQAKMFLNLSDKRMAFDASQFNANNGLVQNQETTTLTAERKQGAFAPDTLTELSNFKTNNAALKVAAKRFSDAHELANVTVTAKAKSNIDKMDDKYTSGMFKGGDAKQFDVANDPFGASSLSVFNYLQGKVAGLQITTGATPSLSWRGGTPVVYLDEMQTDVNQVNSLNMADVAYIKVINPSSAGIISSNGGGVILVYTKRGGDDGVAKPTSNTAANLAKIQGYSAIKQFYSPDYATANGEEFYDDNRTTLFWEPLIFLDQKKPRYKFEFYNNDFTKRFRVVLEGLNANGKLIHVEKVIEKE